VLKKKSWANFQRIIELFSKNIVKKLLKIWSWDPGSGKNLFRVPDPWVKKGTGSRIRIRNTGEGVSYLSMVITTWLRGGQRRGKKAACVSTVLNS
jgi:hypothetical protein